MFSTNTPHRVRLLALLTGLALTAAACSGGGADDDLDSSGTDSSGTDSTDTDSSDTDSTDTESSAPATQDDAASLISPTATEAPFSSEGGATSGGDGVIIVADDPRSALENNVASATGEWPTDWTRQAASLDELQLGIPADDPRDRIPPIDLPQFEPLVAASWLSEREPGALVQFNDEVRFYPLSILTRHEIVNDRYGDIPVVVTFCPLCNTAISFDGRVDGQALRFGVSGLLRKSDLVMWDSETVTLWQQLTGEAIVGELAGTKLDLISTSIVSYGDVLEAFPDALSLSRQTGFGIDYGANGYVGYSSSSQPFLFDGDPDPRFPALSRVIGVSVEEENKAYPFDVVAQSGGAVNDTVSGVPIAVFWGGDTADALDGRTVADGAAIGTGIAFDRRVGDQELTFAADGDDRFVDTETATTWTLLGQGIEGPLAGEQLSPVDHRNEFWFAWAAFFPEAPVYGAE